MERPKTLLAYPYVTVRVACRYCKRRGQYRLARLAATFGHDISLAELLKKLAWDCEHWKPKSRWGEGCGVHFPDLEASPPRPPEEPPALRKLSIIDGGRK